MIFEELPRDIICHITSFLVNENVNTIVHVDSYCNLSLVNKEIYSYIEKYKDCVIEALYYSNLSKRNIRIAFSKVLSSILNYVPLLSPVCSNDRCLGCNKKLPYWFPVLNNRQYREIIDINQKLINIPDFSRKGIEAGYCMENKKCKNLYEKFTYSILYYYEDEEEIPEHICKICRNRINYTLLDNINCKNQEGKCGKCKINFKYLR